MQLQTLQAKSYIDNSKVLFPLESTIDDSFNIYRNPTKRLNL